MARAYLYATLVATALLIGGCDPTPTEELALPTADANAIEAYIRYLADDARQGRETGSSGYDQAAQYVADQFKAIGLKPAGEDGTYFQAVPLRGVRLIFDDAKFIIHGPDGDRALAVGSDFMPVGRPHLPHSETTAGVVFVGYGVEAPAFGHDDYAGLDVKGKIVAILDQTTTDLPSEIAAYYGSPKAKAQAAIKHGAIGAIVLYTKRSEQILPFAALPVIFGGESMTWRDANGAPFVLAPELANAAFLGQEASEALFAGAAKSYAEVRAEAAEGAPAGFPLAVEVTLAQSSRHRDLMSSNVVAVLEGGDAKLKNEYVVLSAHLDHIGIGEPDENGDTINNGAMDNAAGVATMLEAARAFTQAKTRPRRSILFLADTGEEKGLVGSDFFIRNPTVPVASIVADVNLDMPMLLYDFTDVIAFGADHSSLGPTVAEAAARMGLSLSPDPMPEQAIFVRSDHFSFVEQDIPAVFLVTGFNSTEGDGKGGEVFADFLAHHYHQPSDDVNLPISYEAGAKFAETNYLIAREIADADKRPSWNQGDFFGDLFAER